MKDRAADYLILDNSARINTPSTLGQNWRWRLSDRDLTPEKAKEILKLTRLYGRTSEVILTREAKEKAAKKAKVEALA